MEASNSSSSVFLFITILLTLLSYTWGCATRSGWGQPQPLVLPRPTLIPKLRAAFLDGQASVAFQGRGWAHHVPQQPHPPPFKPQAPLNINGLGWDSGKVVAEYGPPTGPLTPQYGVPSYDDYQPLPPFPINQNFRH